MRYRKLVNGDYPFGGLNEFLIDSPEAVAQAINTRLSLHTGQWFLDTTDGTAYDPEIVGAHTQGTRDLEVRARILDTPGVEAIVEYSSDFDAAARRFSVSATVKTIYGSVGITL